VGYGAVSLICSISYLVTSRRTRPEAGPSYDQLHQ
jgi:hypothetical protein